MKSVKVPAPLEEQFFKGLEDKDYYDFLFLEFNKICETESLEIKYYFDADVIKATKKDYEIQKCFEENLKVLGINYSSKTYGEAVPGFDFYHVIYTIKEPSLSSLKRLIKLYGGSVS